MFARADELRDKVVVITGATSGIGRAAALAFARRGCRLALAARRGEVLQEVAELCRAEGARALPVVTDVTRDQDVRRLVDEVLATWGAIDVWINNAGVTLFATLDQAPFAEHERVIETNLLGAMRCARAVVPIFLRQRRGTLINVGSVLSRIGQPFVPSYAISKFGLRGLSQSLSAQLAEEPHVHVCTLLPFTVDTPHFQSGANHVHRHPRALPPMQSPERVARALVSLAEKPRRELHVPRIAVLGLAAHQLFPTTTERLLLRALRRWHFDEQAQPSTAGNLYQAAPADEGDSHGDRKPQLGTPAFLGWNARELVRMEWQSLRRWSRAHLPGGAARDGG